MCSRAHTVRLRSRLRVCDKLITVSEWRFISRCTSHSRHEGIKVIWTGFVGAAAPAGKHRPRANGRTISIEANSKEYRNFYSSIFAVQIQIDIRKDAKHKFTLIQFEFIKWFASTSLLRGRGCHSGSECASVFAVDRVNHELIPAAIHSIPRTAQNVYSTLGSSQSDCRHRNHTIPHSSQSDPKLNSNFLNLQTTAYEWIVFEPMRVDLV